MKNLIKTLFFLFLTLIIFLLLSRIIGIEKSDSIFTGLGEKQHEEYYELEDDSLDVIFLGSSHAYTCISPLDLYDEYGYTSFVLGSSCQKIWQSYHYLEEAFRTQSPSVVVLETFMVLDTDVANEAHNRMAIDPMRLSIPKLRSIKRATDKNPKEDIASYLLPLLRYHDRWQNLTQEDFYYAFHDYDAFAKGYSPRFGLTPVTFPLENYEEGSDSYQTVTMGEESAVYLNAILSLCQENGATLLLVKTPTCNWNLSKYQAIADWAQSHGVAYYDMNADEEIRNTVGIDWSTDSLDGSEHVNYYGAVKVNAWVGQMLNEGFSFEDKRGNEAYAEWAKDKEMLDQVVLEQESHAASMSPT